MNFLLFCLILTINCVYAVEIRLPIFFEGAKEDLKNKKGNFYVYEVAGKLENSDIVQTKFSHPLQNIEQLVSTLIYAYRQNDQLLFKSLFSDSALTALEQMPPLDFKKRFSSYKDIKEPVLDFYFEHNSGYVARWKDLKNGDKSELIYVKNENGLRIFPFSALPEDFRFFNISYFLTFRTFYQQKAQVVKNVNSAKKDYVLELRVKMPYVTFLKKENNKWVKKRFLKDNVSDKYDISDSDSRPGFIKLQFNRDNFTKNTAHDILVVESNYPIAYLSSSFASEGQVKVFVSE